MSGQKTVLGLAVALGLIASAAPSASSAAEGGLSDLQGTWQFKKVVAPDGSNLYDSKECKLDLKYVMKGHRFGVVKKGERTRWGEIRIDASKTPSQIDLEFKDGDVGRGIFQVEQGTLKLAFPIGLEEDRPKDFKSHTHLVLQKVPDK